MASKLQLGDGKLSKHWRWSSQSLKTLGNGLIASLKTLWRCHQKKLKRCQKHISEPSVHDLRVETRRLLSKLELIANIIARPYLKKVQRRLKSLLDDLDEIRDTQVQLQYVKKMCDDFPEMKPFQKRLRQCESDLVKPTAKAVCRFKVDKVDQCIRKLKKQLTEMFTHQRASAHRLATLEQAVQQAFEKVVRLRQSIVPGDPRTIHGTRIAFKHFRYMVEAVQPLLHGIDTRQLQAMHSYQTRMGDIQDMEVLLASIDRFAERQELPAKVIRKIRQQLVSRRDCLIKAYLESADQLYTFWNGRN